MFRTHLIHSPWIAGLLISGMLCFLPLLISAQSNQAVPVVTAAQADGLANHVRLLGHIGGAVDAVYLDGNYLYIGEGSTLTILDITDPTQPQRKGKTEPLADSPEAIVVHNHLAYIAAGDAGLRIFDVSDPANPLRRGFFDATFPVHDLHIADGYAYLAADDGGLRILDIQNAASPVEVGSYPLPDYATAVYVSGRYAYVTVVSFLGLSFEQTGLYIIDIQNPRVPTFTGYLNAPDDPTGLLVANGYAYIGRTSGLWVVDVTNPARPAEVMLHSIEGPLGQVTLVGSHLYVAEIYAGIHVFDVSAPLTPQEIQFFPVSNATMDLFVSDTLVYLATHQGGLRVMDVAELSAPEEIGRYDPAEYTAGIYSLDGYLTYVAAGENGLHVLDTRDPTAPVELVHYEMPGSAQDIQLVGNRAYIAAGESGLQIVDVSIPTSPRLIGTHDTPGRAYGLDVVANLVYLADGAGGLRIVDVTNPALPNEVGANDIPMSAWDVAVNSSNAYVAGFNEGLRVLNVDLREPTAPFETGFLDSDDVTSHVQADWYYAYLADGEGGLRIIDITHSNAPAEVGVYLPPGGGFLGFPVVSDVFISGQYAYVAAGASGMRVVDLSDPTAPTEAGFYQPPAYLERIFVTNRTIYATSNTGELYLMRFPDCYRLALEITGDGALPAARPAGSDVCQTGEFLPGTAVTLQASPATGWRVSSWVGTSSDNTTSAVNQLVMPAADHTVVVNYAPICYQLIRSHSGEGEHPSAMPLSSTGCSLGTYVAGQAITLTATPGTGSTVSGWSGTSNDNTTAITNTLTMPAGDHNVLVNYVPACYPLKLTHTGTGSDPSPSPIQSVNCPTGHYHYNDTVALTAVPAQGWLVNAWSGTNNNSATTTTNSITIPPIPHEATVHYGEIPVEAPGDQYELDNSCTRSTPITTDGQDVQVHTFHNGNDVDWVRFDTVAGVLYRVEVIVPNGSTVDVTLELYPDCESAPTEQSSPSFSTGARLDMNRTESGPSYLRLVPNAQSNTGSTATYQVSVRNISTPPANRALIIVAGHLKNSDSLQPNIEHLAKRAYELFQSKGYGDEDIYLLSTDATLVGRDASPTVTNLKSAITEWAAPRVANGVFTIYMVDHGAEDVFYLDDVSQQVLTPTMLNEWLTLLEQQATGVKTNVILESCQSGSFIAKKNGAISGSGRLIMTSSNDIADARASSEGAYFSDHLLTWLQQDYSMQRSFEQASAAAQAVFRLQESWLDVNGDGLPNRDEDYRIAAQRGFAFPGTLPGDTWAPEIFQVQQLAEVIDGTVRMGVDARDDVSVRQVWVVVYPPDYVPPSPAQSLQPEVLPTFLLQRTSGDTAWEAEITGLQQQGLYQLIVHAEDGVGMVAKPVVLTIDTRTKRQLYLPIIAR